MANSVKKTPGKMPGHVTSLHTARLKGCGRDATLASMSISAHLPPPLDLAQRLMREADIELFAGHHAAAERLAHRAAELRGWDI